MKIDFLELLMVVVVFFFFGLSIGITVTNSLCAKRAIEANVAHYVITDKSSGKTEFQFKTNLVELVPIK